MQHVLWGAARSSLSAEGKCFQGRMQCHAHLQISELITFIAQLLQLLGASFCLKHSLLQDSSYALLLFCLGLCQLVHVQRLQSRSCPTACRPCILRKPCNSALPSNAQHSSAFAPVASACSVELETCLLSALQQSILCLALLGFSLPTAAFDFGSSCRCCVDGFLLLIIPGSRTLWIRYALLIDNMCSLCCLALTAPDEQSLVLFAFAHGFAELYCTQELRAFDVPLHICCKHLRCPPVRPTFEQTITGNRRLQRPQKEVKHVY